MIVRLGYTSPIIKGGVKVCVWGEVVSDVCDYRGESLQTPGEGGWD